MSVTPYICVKITNFKILKNVSQTEVISKLNGCNNINPKNTPQPLEVFSDTNSFTNHVTALFPKQLSLSHKVYLPSLSTTF